MPIGEDEWVTIGTLDEEFDLEQVNREIVQRGLLEDLPNLPLFLLF